MPYSMYIMNVTNCMYMWCHTDHPAFRVVPTRDSKAIFRPFHVNAFQTQHIQSVSSYFWM